MQYSRKNWLRRVYTETSLQIKAKDLQFPQGLRWHSSPLLLWPNFLLILGSTLSVLAILASLLSLTIQDVLMSHDLCVLILLYVWKAAHQTATCLDSLLPWSPCSNITFPIRLTPPTLLKLTHNIQLFLYNFPIWLSS